MVLWCGLSTIFLAMFGILTICPRFQELPLMQWRYVSGFSKFVGVIRSAVIHRSFGGLSFRYIFVLFGMGDFGSISFNGTIDLWDASDIIIWDYWYRYNSLCVVDCPGGHVAKWQSACDDGVAVCCGPIRIGHYGFTLWCYVVLCAWLMPFCGLMPDGYSSDLWVWYWLCVPLL